MIAHIIDGGDAELLEGEAERLRQAVHAPDVDDVGLKLGDGVAQGLVVVRFEVLELAEA